MKLRLLFIFHVDYSHPMDLAIPINHHQPFENSLNSAIIHSLIRYLARMIELVEKRKEVEEMHGKRARKETNLRDASRDVEIRNGQNTVRSTLGRSDVSPRKLL